jgi:lipopolysaccharide heptosyltransferase I
MARELARRILIVRLGAIGDVVNAQVLANAIKRADPTVRIGWAVHELSQPIVQGHPSVDRVHLWRRSARFAGWRDLIAEIRAEGYELAIDLQRIAKSAALARASGAPRMLGFDRRRAKEGSWMLATERIAPADPGAHMVEQYLEFARHLGIEAPRAEFLFPADPSSERWAERWVQDAGGPPILLNVGASRPSKQWPPGNFGELARAAREAFGLPVALTGSPGDRAQAELAFARIPDRTGIHDLVGKTSLLELAALHRRCAVLVACDTGPLHLAVANGAPIVALFGATDPRRTGPFRQQERVVRVAVPCSPCHLKQCNQSRHFCMEDLSVEQVLAKLRVVLAASAPERGLRATQP